MICARGVKSAIREVRFGGQSSSERRRDRFATGARTAMIGRRSEGRSSHPEHHLVQHRALDKALRSHGSSFDFWICEQEGFVQPCGAERFSAKYGASSANI